MRIKKSLFYRYLLSYLLITAVPLLLLSAVLYRNSVANLRQEVEASNISKLTQVKNLVDQRMNELSHIAFRISQDNRLSRFQLGKGEYQAIEAVEELRKYKANSILIDHLFLTFRDDDHIYSSAGKFSQASFHTYFYKNEEWDRAKFFREVNRLAYPTVKVLIESKSETTDPPRVLGYIFPLTSYSSQPFGAVIFTIEQSKLSNLIGGVLGEFHGEAYILNENGQIMAGTRRGEEASAVREQALAADYRSTGVYRLDSGKDSFSLVTVRSDTTDWQFITVIPTREFLGRVIEMRALVVQIIVFVALIGAGTAVFFASNHYRPFKKWLRLLQSENPVPAADGQKERRNELELIGETAFTLLASNRELREKVLSQRDFLREQLFTKLLTGKLRDGTEYAELTRAAELQFNGDAYGVLLIAGGPMRDGWHILEEIRTVLNGLVIPGHRLFVVEAPDEEALAIIVQREAAAAGDFRLMHIGADVRDAILEHTRTEAYVGIGGDCAAIERIHRSYVEAAAALELIRLKKEPRLCRFDEIAERETKEFWYPVDEQIRFTQSLKQGNRTLALENMESIVQSIAAKGTSLMMLRYICFDIVNSMTKTVQEIHRTEFTEEINSLMSFASIEQLKQRMEALTVKVCGYVDGLKASRNSVLFGKILQHVHERYADALFSLESVADHTRVTPSYLSKFFKEQMGTTFSEYVTGLRMAEVKRQLVETDKPIKEIVESSGYSDLSSFVRKFKSLEGVTPGQYRKLYTGQAEGLNGDV